MGPPLFSLLLALILTQWSFAQQDNGIVGDPIVDCADSYFEVRFETRNPFRGLVFVQDRLEDPRCRSPPVIPGGLQNASLRLAFKDCGVERRISVSSKSIFYSNARLFHAIFFIDNGDFWNTTCGSEGSQPHKFWITIP
ncbi:hypothetical protein ANCDUO_03838 [Ancylostoma duodenale]|uniref:ZP domain-containing protein n=1 Tax=Ancylostoma duodenale TaxID=51022 RepID=A0A0C2GWD2_9BILA|nr:hypothetical protein ANCDUO_03838 [Ancylostoma duodenale]